MAARVLVVDDSAFMRKILSEMVASDAAFEVAGTARDGADALAKIAQLRPDLVTLDVEMPVLGGLDTLRRLRDLPLAKKPRVVMCSSLTREGSDAALTALNLGAADFVAKDASIAVTGLDELKRDLLSKLKELAPKGSARVAEPPAAPAGPAPTAVMPARPGVLAIGSSTGGPPVLEKILSRLPRDLPCPVVVAQHMPALFTRSLSERLNNLGPLPVVHAEEGEQVLDGGTVYIIKGALNGHVLRQGARTVLRVCREPVDAIYKPSVNVLLETAGTACGKSAVGVVLTGMGDDGLQGGRQLVLNGGVILSQDEASSVVYGMPRAVADAGLSTTMTPDAISRCLLGLSPGNASRRAG